MSSRHSQISGRRLADLVGIVQVEPLRVLFRDLMRSMRDLPLTPFDLADFLRLVEYHEIREDEVSDESLPVMIALLERFLSQSTNELLETLSILRAQEWSPASKPPLWPALERTDSLGPALGAPAFRVPSFHDPPDLISPRFSP